MQFRFSLLSRTWPSGGLIAPRRRPDALISVSDCRESAIQSSTCFGLFDLGAPFCRVVLQEPQLIAPIAKAHSAAPALRRSAPKRMRLMTRLRMCCASRWASERDLREDGDVANAPVRRSQEAIQERRAADVTCRRPCRAIRVRRRTVGTRPSRRPRQKPASFRLHQARRPWARCLPSTGKRTLSAHRSGRFGRSGRLSRPTSSRRKRHATSV